MPTAADAVVISWETVPGVYNPDTAVCNFALDVGLVGFQVIAEAVNESAGTTRSYVVDHWRGRFTAPLDLGAAPLLEVSPAGPASMRLWPCCGAVETGHDAGYPVDRSAAASTLRSRNSRSRPLL